MPSSSQPSSAVAQADQLHVGQPGQVLGVRVGDPATANHRGSQRFHR
jgi:hypothetical protein